MDDTPALPPRPRERTLLDDDEKRANAMLDELLDAVGVGDTLPWVLRHAPDGAADAAIAWAWARTVRIPFVLNELLHEAGTYDAAAADAALRAARDATGWSDHHHPTRGTTRAFDLAYAAAIRARVPPPTLVELLRRRASTDD